MDAGVNMIDEIQTLNDTLTELHSELEALKGELSGIGHMLGHIDTTTLDKTEINTLDHTSLTLIPALRNFRA